MSGVAMQMRLGAAPGGGRPIRVERGPSACGPTGIRCGERVAHALSVPLAAANGGRSMGMTLPHRHESNEDRVPAP